MLSRYKNSLLFLRLDSTNPNCILSNHYNQNAHIHLLHTIILHHFVPNRCMYDLHDHFYNMPIQSCQAPVPNHLYRVLRGIHHTSSPYPHDRQCPQWFRFLYTATFRSACYKSKKTPIVPPNDTSYRFQKPALLSSKSTKNSLHKYQLHILPPEWYHNKFWQLYQA